MSNRVGICPVCETKQRIYYSGHEPAMRWHPGIGTKFSERECTGSGKRPLLTKEQLKRAAGRVGACDPFRIHAAVALDAWIERKKYPKFDIDILCAVACREYAWRHNMPWQHVGTVHAVARFASRESKRFDLYCQFCGQLLVLNVKAPNETAAKFSHPDRHPTECALKHLAFALEPAAPNVRRLPDEYVNEDTAPLLGGPTR